MDRYKPKKHKIPVKAIGEHCKECMGGKDSQGYKKRIAECPSPDCALFNFRFGKNPNHKQKLSDLQKKTLADRGMNSFLIQRAVGKSQPNLNDQDLVDT